MPTPLSSLAVIDGTLRHLTRRGTPAEFYAPLATAVMEFRRGPMWVYVREHPHGLLPGIPNLYCVDASLKLKWMAEWPDPQDPCTRILETDADSLTAESATGAVLRIDAHTGRLLGMQRPIAAAG